MAHYDQRRNLHNCVVYAAQCRRWARGEVDDQYRGSFCVAVTDPTEVIFYSVTSAAIDTFWQTDYVEQIKVDRVVYARLFEGGLRSEAGVVFKSFESLCTLWKEKGFRFLNSAVKAQEGSTWAQICWNDSFGLQRM
jgi:hypothetical protein